MTNTLAQLRAEFGPLPPTYQATIGTDAGPDEAWLSDGDACVPWRPDDDDDRHAADWESLMDERCECGFLVRDHDDGEHPRGLDEVPL